MSPFVRSSFKKLSILTAILIAVTVVFYFIKPEWIHQAVPIIFVLFVGLSVGATFIANQANKEDAKFSTTLYLGIMSGRLIVSIIFLALFLILDRSNQYVFVGNFFTLYLCYAIFDITGLVANLRTDFREH